MVEAGETIVTEIVLFPLLQKEVGEEGNVQATESGKNLDVVLDNTINEDVIHKKLEGKKLNSRKI